MSQRVGYVFNSPQHRAFVFRLDFNVPVIPKAGATRRLLCGLACVRRAKHCSILVEALLKKCVGSRLKP